MDDTISRQAVLDAIDEISREVDDGYGFDYAKWREYFCELPSIQFATDTNVGNKLGTNLAEVGTDCISRQQAIDAIDDQIEQCDKALCSFDISMKDEYAVKVERASLTAYKEQLEYLPSIQPEPKRGKWIQDRSGAYCCSKCMEPCATYVMGKPRDKFCKMCGSRNEVTE